MFESVIVANLLSGLSISMKKSFLRKISLLFLIAALCLISACADKPPGSPAGQPSRERVAGKRGGAITYRMTSPPRTFNPLLPADEASLTIAYYLLSSRLVDFEHDKQSYVPALAESWKKDADGRTLEITLRDGLKFSDGQPLTSEDVAFTFRGIYDDRTGTPILNDAMRIGGKEIEVAVIDARNLRLVFPETVASPESYMFNLPVVPRHVLEEEFKQGKLGSAWSITSDPQRIITSGPFTLSSYTPGERVTLQRNANYWKKDEAGTQLPYLDTLTIEIIGDSNNAFARLTGGSIDIIDRVRANDYAGLQSSQGSVRGVDLGPGLSTDYIWFNLNEGDRDGKPIVQQAKRAWFGDARFRRAVSHAVDRQSIAISTLQGLATPLYTMISPGNHAWTSTDLPRAEYDLAKARALLEESGFVMRGTPQAPELYDSKGNRVEWTMIVPVENEARKLMAAVIQEDLAKLGMKVQVAPIEFQALTDRWTTSFDYDAILLGSTLTDTDPSAYANLLLSDSVGHQWHPKQKQPATEWEARLNELATRQSHEIDLARRQAIIREIQLVIIEQAPIIPLFARHVLSAANARVGNYRPSPIFPFSVWNAEELFVKE